VWRLSHLGPLPQRGDARAARVIGVTLCRLVPGSTIMSPAGSFTECAAAVTTPAFDRTAF
jgi:hypothetical protein